MFNFKRKTDWINGLNTGLIGRNETVTLWVLPTARCVRWASTTLCLSYGMAYTTP